MDISPAWDRHTLLTALPFQPLWHAIADLQSAAFPTLAECNAQLSMRQPPVVTQSGHRLRFVPQDHGKLPFEAQYEPRCYLKGEVQTRADNWHDLLNALVWLAFPRAKAAINARHFHALMGAADGRSQRGAVRDTNTLFDESGVIVPYADPELAELLRSFRWRELFWQHRGRLQSAMGFCLFGHGLYEKTLNPYVGLTGQGLLLAVEPAFFGWPLAQRIAHLDDLVADYLNDPRHCTSTRELTPVPLLGVPGWTAENEDSVFYDNTGYFRPARAARTAGDGR